MTTKDMPELLDTLRRQAEAFQRISGVMKALSDDAERGMDVLDLVRRTAIIHQMFFDEMRQQKLRDAAINATTGAPRH